MENIWVDFKAVKAVVTMRMVLDYYGLTATLKVSGDELRGRCPIHKGEGADAFHVNVQKNCFQCFVGSCKVRGNVLDFVAAIEQCTVRDAAVKLAEWFDIASLPARGERSSSNGKKTPAPTREQSGGVETKKSGAVETPEKNKALTFELKGVDPDHSYLAERGIDRKTAELFGVGFFPGKGSMSGRVVIPIHNGGGELVAYAGRSVDSAEPRYKLPARFQKSLELYNLHRAVVDNVPRMVVIVEGFFDCLRVYQAGFPPVALMGCSMSERQEELLAEHFRAAWLMLDGDQAGRTAATEVAARLVRRMFVRVVDVGDGNQPDMLSGDELRNLLN